MYNQSSRLLTNEKRAASGEEEHGNEEIVSGVPVRLLRGTPVDLLSLRGNGNRAGSFRYTSDEKGSGSRFHDAGGHSCRRWERPGADDRG